MKLLKNLEVPKKTSKGWDSFVSEKTEDTIKNKYRKFEELVIVIVVQYCNKPGTAQVGAISKAQKIAEGLQSVKYSLLQYPREKKIEKNPNYLNFFSKFFWSLVRRIVPKDVKRGPLGVFEHPFFCKIGKNEGRH